MCGTRISRGKKSTSNAILRSCSTCYSTQGFSIGPGVVYLCPSSWLWDHTSFVAVNTSPHTWLLCDCVRLCAPRCVCSTHWAPSPDTRNVVLNKRKGILKALSQTLWHKSVIQLLRRLRQENDKFKTCPGYRSLRPVWITRWNNMSPHP